MKYEIIRLFVNFVYFTCLTEFRTFLGLRSVRYVYCKRSAAWVSKTHFSLQTGRNWRRGAHGDVTGWVMCTNEFRTDIPTNEFDGIGLKPV